MYDANVVDALLLHLLLRHMPRERLVRVDVRHDLVLLAAVPRRRLLRRTRIRSARCIAEQRPAERAPLRAALLASATVGVTPGVRAEQCVIFFNFPRIKHILCEDVERADAGDVVLELRAAVEEPLGDGGYVDSFLELQEGV